MINRMINYFAFAVLALLWIGFGAALLFNQEMLNTVWQSFRGLPLVAQLLAGLLLLPVVLGLWIWQMPWAIWLRLILVAGLAWVTIYTFFPRKMTGQSQASAVKA